MLIKSLRMENFRQFKGSTYVTFSCDPERNVTIILGDNTFGKTTLLQAFNWCFYGVVMFDQNPDFLLNLEVANEMIITYVFDSLMDIEDDCECGCSNDHEGECDECDCDK